MIIAVRANEKRPYKRLTCHISWLARFAVVCEREAVFMKLN